MIPALDTPDEVAAMIGAVLSLLAIVGVGLAGAVAAVWAAWSAKVRPLLSETKAAAQTAAHELRNNSGSSTRDAVDRVEAIALELRDSDRELRTEMRELRSAKHSAHSEIFERLRMLESANRPDERN